ncbi:MAG: tetratricopeptide repeat protein [Nitrospirae bacterium]|nr:tetratricopeptide repeat protein [Nitrospirota bacterium]
MNQRLTRKEIKRDQVQEALVRVMDYLRENLRSLLLLAGLVLLIMGAFAAYWSYLDRKESKASEELARAIRIYSAEIVDVSEPTATTNPTYGDAITRDAEARRQFELVVGDYGSSDAAAIAKAYLGEMAARSADLEGARQLWEEFLESQGDHMLASEVRLNLMSVDRAQGRGQELVTQIRALLEEPETDLPKDVLLYQLALTQRELGLAPDARQTMQQILDEHPQSIYAAEARAELGAGDAGNPLAGI